MPGIGCRLKPYYLMLRSWGRPHASWNTEVSWPLAGWT